MRPPYIDRFLLPKEHVLENLRDAVINGDEETAKKLSEEIVNLGVDSLEVIEKYLSPAMKLVGQEFENGEYFLSLKSFYMK